MEPEGSSPCSQKPAIGPYPEPAEKLYLFFMTFMMKSRVDEVQGMLAIIQSKIVFVFPSHIKKPKD
jgi:hypothetical protein